MVVFLPNGPEDVRVYSYSYWPPAAEGLASPAAPVAPPACASSVVAAAEAGATTSTGRASFAVLPDPQLGKALDHRLLAGYPEALFAAAGARGVPNDGAPPWSLPVPAPPLAGGSSGASGSSGGVGLGMAVLSLLSLLYLGGKPPLSARDLPGPACVPRLIPELPG